MIFQRFQCMRCFCHWHCWISPSWDLKFSNQGYFLSILKMNNYLFCFFFVQGKLIYIDTNILINHMVLGLRGGKNLNAIRLLKLLLMENQENIVLIVQVYIFQNKRIQQKMVQEFFTRLENLWIVEGRFCFSKTHQLIHLENVKKNGSAHNEIGWRIPFIGMGGIGNLTSSVFPRYGSDIVKWFSTYMLKKFRWNFWNNCFLSALNWVYVMSNIWSNSFDICLFCKFIHIYHLLHLG